MTWHPMVRAFKLPLSAGAFSDALAKGHGRALMHVRRHGLAGLEDFLLHACLHDLRYDRQCEANRTSWLGEFFEGAPDWIAGPVLRRLVDHEEHNHDIWQLARLGLLLARRGHPAAREALYTAFGFYEDGQDLVAQEEILDLDGEQGFLWMAGRLGRWVGERQQVDSWLVDSYAMRTQQAEETLMQSRAKVAQLMARSLDPDVRRYLEHLVESGEERSLGLKPAKKARQTETPATLPRAADVLRGVRDGRPAGYWLDGWGRKADDEELRIVAAALFQTTDGPQLAKLLKVFQARALPEFDARLIELADHPDQDVRWMLHWVLSWHAEPEVRQLALERLRAARIEEGEIRLLRRTYQLGDHRLLSRALENVPSLDPDVRHSVLTALLDVLCANPHPSNRGLLLSAYEHTPCSYCREEAVKIMLELDVLPAWVRRECKFDAIEEIRARFAG